MFAAILEIDLLKYHSSHANLLQPVTFNECTMMAVDDEQVLLGHKTSPNLHGRRTNTRDHSLIEVSALLQGIILCTNFREGAMY